MREPPCGMPEPRNKGQGVGDGALFTHLLPTFVPHSRGGGEEGAPAWVGREGLQQGVGRACQQESRADRGGQEEQLHRPAGAGGAPTSAAPARLAHLTSPPLSPCSRQAPASTGRCGKDSPRTTRSPSSPACRPPTRMSCRT